MSTDQDSDGTQPGGFWVMAYRCRCGHEWAPRPLGKVERPRICPKCKSANWDQPRRYARRQSADSGEYGQC